MFFIAPEKGIRHSVIKSAEAGTWLSVQLYGIVLFLLSLICFIGKTFTDRSH